MKSSIEDETLKAHVAAVVVTVISGVAKVGSTSQYTDVCDHLKLMMFVPLTHLSYFFLLSFYSISRIFQLCEIL